VTPEHARATPSLRAGSGETDAMRALAIDVRGLTKHFDGRAVVDHLSIRVEKGLIFGFLGPNGSGKTTTIRMLCGLLPPDEGEGSCLGHDLRTDAASIKREVGYMTQRFSLYEDLSIGENLDFVARMYAVPDRKEAIDATLDRLHLTARRAQLVAEYTARFANPYVAAERGYVDGVIEPRETRRELIRGLRLCLRKQVERPARKHGNIPL